jgi:hypothetical protein
MKTDKKFRKLAREHELNPLNRGTHLVRVESLRRGVRHVRVEVERNQVRQAAFVPSAPRGMRWRKGKLVPRDAKFPEMA